MKFIALISLLTISFYCTSQVQDSIRRKPRLYDTWISSDRLNTYLRRGELYEVKDSSILVSDSGYKQDYTTGNFRTAEINFSKIESIKLRMANSIKKGAIIGSSIGLGITALMSVMVLQDGGDGMILGPLLMMGIGSIGICGGIGVLTGSIKTTIPLGRNYENFNNNKSKLSNYACVQKGNIGFIEHGSYIGMQMGPSFPVGNFADKSKVSEYAKNGYFTNVINLGYMLKPNIGISIAGFDNQYDAGDNSDEKAWKLTGIVAGPLFSFPAGKKFFFDLKPRIGYVDVTFYTDEKNQSTTPGLAINPGASFRYNLFKRWSLDAETGYLYSKIEGNHFGEEIFQTINLSIGIAYRFR